MSANDEKLPRCSECKTRNKICRVEDGQGPTYCPTIKMSEVIEHACTEYDKPDIKEFARYASIQEGECYVNKGANNPNARYAIKPRVQETIEFCHKMGYKRLGLAFCDGLRKEAAILTEILKTQGFEVASVVCKTGRTPKEFLGLTEDQKINPGSFESMCSPIVQAAVLNEAETDFNILVGLCVGHDSLFMKYSKALCTALVVKDRVTGHNPLAAIQLYESYYSKLIKQEFKKGGSVTVSVKEND
ncbi:MAG: DUF1847 domain-containing protein [Spirochaetales bacterium]|nr:DUF1847 domain-containing protein [Spirochaetales bacterium]